MIYGRYSYRDSCVVMACAKQCNNMRSVFTLKLKFPSKMNIVSDIGSIRHTHTHTQIYIYIYTFTVHSISEEFCTFVLVIISS